MFESIYAPLAAQAAKATVILAAASFATALMWRASASSRHLVWVSAFVALSLMPLAEMTVPSWRPQLLETTAADPAAPETRTLPWVITVFATPEADSFSWPRWMLMAWASGASVVLLRFGAGIWRVSQLTRSAQAFEPEILVRLLNRIVPATAVRLLRSSQVAMPMTWGARDPVILLPAEAGFWPEDRLRMVLAHELIHVKRRDWMMQAISQLACALHWFNPLVWFAADRLTQERERACDDAVLALGEKGSEYAGQLLEMVRSLGGSRRRFVEGVAMARSHLEGRIRAMLDPGRRRGTAGRKGAAVTTVAMLCLLIPLAALRAPAQSAAATLSGTVRDPSGATVPKAEVTAIHSESGKRAIVSTSDTGEFSMKGILAGSYAVQVRKPGFAVLEMREVTVPANEEVKLALTLNIGRIQETVEVTATREPSVKPQTPTRAGSPVRIRVGGNVQATKMISKVNPSYPASMKAQGIEGTVLLRTVISKAGVPLEIEVLSMLAHPDLVAAATDAVRQWRYQPTLLNGNPVEVITDITVNFRLAE